MLPAGPDRLGAIARTRLPYVGSFGALDMVNFWAPETVPERFRGRLLLPPQPERDADAHHAGGDAARSARWIAGKLNACEGPVRFLIPERGVSALDVARRQPFHDPEADAALFDAIEDDAASRPTGAGCVRLPLHINDPPSPRRSSPPSARSSTRRAQHARHRPRKTSSTKFRDMIAAGEPIVGGGAGTGLSAKCEEAGGIDLIVIYNSGRYRMAGRGSPAGLLAYGNANEIVATWRARCCRSSSTRRCSPASTAPIPFVLMPQFLAELKALGFSGVQNFPTVGLFDGALRAELRGDRHGLRARGRHDRARPTARPADHALRVQPGRGARDDRGRRRHRRRPHGPDHRRRDRRHHGQDRSTTASREIDAIAEAAR